MAGKDAKPAPRLLARYRALTALCSEEHEAYFPTVGDAYLGRSYFRPSSLGEALGFWRRTLSLIDAGRAPRELGLYLHWPFCLSRCRFCFCAMTTGGPRALAAYARGLLAEIEAFRALFAGREFGSFYLGGGTPTYGPPQILGAVLGALRAFRRSPGAEFYAEASPATLTREKLLLLRRAGVNHVSLGVQSLDAAVLARARRAGQDEGTVARAWRLLGGEAGLLRSADLIYGLEGQTDASFLRDFARLARWGPDGLRVYAFDPREQTGFARGGARAPQDLRRRQWEMMEALDAVARRLGYAPSPLQPEHPDYLAAITRQCRTARRCGASVLGLGASALSHAFGAAWILRAPDYSGGEPEYRCLESGLEEEMRGHLIRQFSTGGAAARTGFRTLFGRDALRARPLARALGDLVAWGKLRVTTEALVMPSKDRVERQLYAKRLYSRGLLRSLGSRHGSAAANGSGPDPSARRVAALMRMYYRPGAPLPAWRALAAREERACA